MSRIIECNSAVECWKQALRTIVEKGKDFRDQNSRICREASNIQITMKGDAEDIDQPINILNSFDEWKYPPIKEIRNVMLAMNPSPDYAYSYGPRIFNFQKKVNQINDFIIPLIQLKPATRKAIVNLWDPEEDSNTLNSEAPGLISLDFKLRNNKLHVVGVIRSNDIFFGWPANICQIRTIQEYVAKRLKCDVGDITTFSVSAHIFIEQQEHINNVLENH